MAESLSATVVVPSHARPVRLLWLLNSLENQSWSEPWEVIVVHDYDVRTADRILGRHTLAARGVLRAIRIPPGTSNTARQGNIACRQARGEHVAFTDDDCRPESEWLQRLVLAARRSPGDVVQGLTRPDPFEREIFRAPHIRTLAIKPVNGLAQTCNILYPRLLLERLGGFDERAVAGEDVELALGARSGGAEVVSARDAVVNHAIESYSQPGVVRQNGKWRYLAYLVKKHPEVRDTLPLRVFWNADHLCGTLAVVGLFADASHPALRSFAAPWLWRTSRWRGATLRQRLISLVEAPGQGVRQLGEVLVLLVGSARFRTVVI